MKESRLTHSMANTRFNKKKKRNQTKAILIFSKEVKRRIFPLTESLLTSFIVFTLHWKNCSLVFIATMQIFFSSLIQCKFLCCCKNLCKSFCFIKFHTYLHTNALVRLEQTEKKCTLEINQYISIDWDKLARWFNGTLAKLFNHSC